MDMMLGATFYPVYFSALPALHSHINMTLSQTKHLLRLYSSTSVVLGESINSGEGVGDAVVTSSRSTIEQQD
jgi:hypothetical protein